MTATLRNWDDLRFFLAVARHGKLAAAGEELGVDHSTVFRRIVALEERLGTRLFDRSARGHQLTAAGEEMLTVADRIEDQILGLGRHVQGRDRELRGLIRVTCAELGPALAEVFRSFLDQHPAVDLEMLLDNRYLSLHRREADVALRPGSRPTEPDLVARRVSSVGWAVYASPDYLARNKPPRRRKDLERHDIVGLGSAQDSTLPSRWLREHAPDARLRYRVNNLASAATAIAAGIGVGLLPSSLVEADSKLVRLFTLKELDDDQLWLVYHGDLRQTARVRAFIDHVADALAA